MKLLQFDTTAWLSNMDLRECSPHDRGILIDLMCLAHKGDPYGHIAKQGTAKTRESIAAYLHLNVDDFQQSVERLLVSGRIGIADHSGAIFIPRMVRDGEIFVASREGGIKGGNPALLPGIVEDAPVKRARPITVKRYFDALPEHLKTDEVREAVSEWIDYRQRRRIVLTDPAMVRQISQLAQLSPDQACRWITCAIDRNWKGFYPPPERFTTAKSKTATKQQAKEFVGHAQPKVISF